MHFLETDVQLLLLCLEWSGNESLQIEDMHDATQAGLRSLESLAVWIEALLKVQARWGKVSMRLGRDGVDWKVAGLHNLSRLADVSKNHTSARVHYHRLFSQSQRSTISARPSHPDRPSPSYPRSQRLDVLVSRWSGRRSY